MTDKERLEAMLVSVALLNLVRDKLYAVGESTRAVTHAICAAHTRLEKLRKDEDDAR